MKQLVCFSARCTNHLHAAIISGCCISQAALDETWLQERVHARTAQLSCSRKRLLVSRSPWMPASLVIVCCYPVYVPHASTGEGQQTGDLRTAIVSRVWRSCPGLSEPAEN
jgi:hypothetical protein